MRCSSCQNEVVPSFKYCPECGTKLEANQDASAASISERFLAVIAEYETLTNTKLSESQKLRFIEDSSVGNLSVNVSERRLTAGKNARIANGDGTYKLDAAQWVNAMYEVEDPKANPTERVWMTAGGERYHTKQDCKALTDGQSFASWKGKETYKPQFVTLKNAAFVLGKLPCEVCKPKPWSQ